MTQYQTWIHGAGEHSAEILEDGKRVACQSFSVVRDINGWHIVGQKYDTPQHATESAAAKWYANMLFLEYQGRKESIK